ncbi:hypothetical protein L227DRAFT_37642 [Lentinus tigrinus ALCF2SS1-6]|uniref:Uncharacterized protein n=1 Tax=Lentinus tigrinus ALCF2SS1-6 TaxID=1328759 RepID=A0A5C2SGZ8_9APHY|nr:hypothetical protein L227DRAFT_37642 [Lentinus tigrinus ALCF2SS1-6]
MIRLQCGMGVVDYSRRVPPSTPRCALLSAQCAEPTPHAAQVSPDVHSRPQPPPLRQCSRQQYTVEVELERAQPVQSSSMCFFSCVGKVRH